MNRKPYIRKIPTTWWLQNGSYRAYMLREFSSPFIAIYTGVLLVGVIRLYQGPEAYDAWLTALQSPLSIGFSVIALALALCHSLSWLKLLPQVMPIQFGETKVPQAALVGIHYAVFITVLIIAIVVIKP
jgi:fumarate reductase subunit C|tara:strand:+ start:2718 stop:3104 length:387 start_codon:yes stop_codon:yes gene_type:complete